jgi:tetratricopeptide (TPR) repeat protein
MLKYFIFFILTFIFSACTNIVPPQIKSNERVFEEEDTYIMFALRAEQVESYSVASDIFYKLYVKSQKKEYLYRSLNNDLLTNNYTKIIQRVDKVNKQKIGDINLTRLKIMALLDLQRYEEAKDISIELVAKSDEVNDYILVSEIYVRLKKYDTAVKYLESAYVKDYNEKILDRMSIVLYVNMQRKKDAIAQLETHARMHGCSLLICKRLIGYYSNDNNVDGSLSAYLRLYKLNPKKDIADKIIQLYVYKKDYIHLINFLEASNTHSEILLQLYINQKNYIKSSKLANEIYKKTGDINFLGKSAIFEYEVNPKDKKVFKSVIKKLKKVIDKIDSGLYLNYLGYILIDHNKDVKTGIKYIDKALKLEPTSIYYLDSKAWGYYKLGKCKKAKKIINKVIKLDKTNNEEVISHFKIITKCVKNKTKGKN